MRKRIFAKICISEQVCITSLVRFRLCFRIMLCCLFAVASLDQAQAAARTISRTYTYSHFKISRSRFTGKALYELKRADGRAISVSSTHDIVKQMQSVMNEQKTDGLKLELEGFDDRPQDAKALLFSLKNATAAGASPFILLEGGKPPSADKPHVDEVLGTIDLLKSHAKLQQAAINEPITSLYVIRKTGEITREERPASPDSYVQHAEIYEPGNQPGNKGKIKITVRSPTFLQLFALIDRFVALLNAAYMDIFAGQIMQDIKTNQRNPVPGMVNRLLTSKNHVDAVRLAKKRLASELGMSDEELNSEIQVEVANMQIAILDWIRIAELME